MKLRIVKTTDKNGRESFSLEEEITVTKGFWWNRYTETKWVPFCVDKFIKKYGDFCGTHDHEWEGELSQIAMERYIDRLQQRINQNIKQSDIIKEFEINE